MPRHFESRLSGEGVRVGIALARFNEAVTSRLLAGALEALKAQGVADDAIWTGGRFADTTGGGLSRITVNTVTSTAMTPTTARPIVPARPGSARIAASHRGPASSLVAGSQRDNEAPPSSVSPSSSSLACGSGFKRRFSRSAGSSVGMRQR